MDVTKRLQGQQLAEQIELHVGSAQSVEQALVLGEGEGVTLRGRPQRGISRRHGVGVGRQKKRVSVEWPAGGEQVVLLHPPLGLLLK